MSFLGCPPNYGPMAGLGAVVADPYTAVVGLLQQVIGFIPQTKEQKERTAMTAEIERQRTLQAQTRAGQTAKTVGTLALAGVALFALSRVLGGRKPRRRTRARKRPTRRRRTRRRRR